MAATTSDMEANGSHQPLVESKTQLKFYVFGHNISHSLSPTIHNTAFKEYGLPYHFSIHQTPAVDDGIRDLINREDFGGASVTFPHKLQIGRLLTVHSEAARLIGAVNTVIVERSEGRKVLKGDNTDWLGILNILERYEAHTGPSIVIGAGGAARAAIFALEHLGVKEVTIVNRTEAHAKKVAAFFPALKITTCETLDAAPTADNIIGCVPADDIEEDDIPEHIFAPTGVVIEMSYRPPVSALMKMARRQIGWHVAEGVDVLKEQAYAQFELWTGRPAPIGVIQNALCNRD